MPAGMPGAVQRPDHAMPACHRIRIRHAADRPAVRLVPTDRHDLRGVTRPYPRDGRVDAEQRQDRDPDRGMAVDPQIPQTPKQHLGKNNEQTALR